jgi:CelD/BcsL family acetyltransferase involved in cellulose biosynthesis
VITTEWATTGFDLPPLAERTGIFPRREFLETWWRHRAGPGDELVIVDTGDALLATLHHDGLVVLAGEADLTDYHTPLSAPGADLLPVVAELAATVPTGTSFRFDSLPLEAAEPLAAALTAVATGVATADHEIAAVLDLPDTYDGYLAALGKKDRHETRRKRRRFAEALGEPALTRIRGVEEVAAFAEMHAKASGDKGRFFTESILEFFQALHTEAGAVIDVLSGADGVPVASAIGFEDDAVYYLYNSAYDPAVGEASPGVVLVGMLIEHAIDAGRTVFDFLKGDETYKFRLGAAPRQLHVVTGRFDATGGTAS